MSKALFFDRIAANVSTWHDTLTAEDRTHELLDFPYLGRGFEFQARDLKSEIHQPLSNIYSFNHAAMVLLGNLANDIPAASEGA